MNLVHGGHGEIPREEEANFEIGAEGAFGRQILGFGSKIEDNFDLRRKYKGPFEGKF